MHINYKYYNDKRALVRAANIEDSRSCLQVIVCKEDFIQYIILGRKLFKIPFDLFW